MAWMSAVKDSWVHQGWHSSKKCPKTAPNHPFDLQKRSTCPLTRMRKFFQIQSPQVFLVCLRLPEKGRTSTDNRHGAFDSNAFHLQPFTRIASLLNFGRIFFPVKHTFSHLKVVRNKVHPFSKISASVFSLLDFKMSLRGQLLNLFIEEVLVGWRGCQLLRIHGSWVQEISWSPSHGQFHRRLTTKRLPVCF